jgi:MFS family permease
VRQILHQYHPYAIGRIVPFTFYCCVFTALSYSLDVNWTFQNISIGENFSMAQKILGKDGFYGWINLAVMFFFYIAVMLLMKAFGQFQRFWLSDFPSWNRPQITGAQTVSLILMGVLSPVVGILIMKWGAKRAIVVGNLFCVTGLALSSFQTKIWHLYLEWGVILGIGMSVGGMLAMMTIINNWFVKKRSIALAVTMFSMGLSGFVFSPLMMNMITTYGWRQTCRIVAAAVFVGCVLLPGLLIKNKPEDIGQAPDGERIFKTDGKNADERPKKIPYTTPVDFTAKEALRTPALWLLVIYGTLIFFTMNGLMTNQIDFLRDIGISFENASRADGILSAVMAISTLGVGFLGLRFSMHSLAIGSMIISIAGYIMILFTHSMPVVLAYCIILGIGFGVQSIAMGNIFPNYFGVSEFPKIMGYTMPFNTLVSSFGTPVASEIRHKMGTYIPAFQLSIVLLIVALICIVFAKPPVHPSLKKQQEPAQTAV